MPLNVLAVDELVVMFPSAFNFEAVTASMISTSETFAPLIKISSFSDFTSYRLPNAFEPCLGTITNVVISGASCFLSYVVGCE